MFKLEQWYCRIDVHWLPIAVPHHCQVGSPEETIGDTPRADIKNEVAKQFVLKMRTAKLADKTIVNYFQVVRAVVASAVSSEMIGNAIRTIALSQSNPLKGPRHS